MAEFCLTCFNEFWSQDLKETDVKLSKHPALCEGCARDKQVVVRVYPRRDEIIEKAIRFEY